MQKAVLFDCDGVLVDSEILLIKQDIKYLADELDLVYEMDNFKHRFLGMTGPDYFASLSSDHEAKHGSPLTEELFKQMHSNAVEMLKEKLEAVRDIEDVVKSISCPMAVASSSHYEWLKEKMRMTGLKDYFGEHIYSGDFVEHGKPAPDIFLYTADKLGIEPANCIVIEDSPNGIKSGMGAGMITIGFTGGLHGDDYLANALKDTGADYVVKTADELSDVIGGLV